MLNLRQSRKGRAAGYRLASFVGTWLCVTSACALAQPGSAPSAFPVRPIKIVATTNPGGPPDLLARWLGERLAAALGQPVIVENRPGAGGNLGMQAVAKSAPDGHTLVVTGQGAFAVNPHISVQPGYDPIADFAPITQLERGALVLAVYPGVPANSVADLIKLAKENPGQLTYGSPGTGLPPHMASELFIRAANIAVERVPYNGVAPAMVDLIAGRITFTFGTPNFQVPQIKAGRIRALAVTSAKRIELLPDVPSIAEAGLPGFEYLGWQGIAAPAGTPREIIARLHAEIVKVLRSPEAREYFVPSGREAVGDTPEEFAAYIKSEYARWGAIIRQAGIKVE